MAEHVLRFSTFYVSATLHYQSIQLICGHWTFYDYTRLEKNPWVQCPFLFLNSKGKISHTHWRGEVYFIAVFIISLMNLVSQITNVIIIKYQLFRLNYYYVFYIRYWFRASYIFFSMYNFRKVKRHTLRFYYFFSSVNKVSALIEIK